MTHEQIMAQTGKTITECSCHICKGMCERSPCLGTPEDMIELVKAGFGYLLSHTVWAAGLQYGIPPIEMVAPVRADGSLSCVFYKGGLCTLHELGLKPIEGKIASCKSTHTNPDTYPPFVIAKTWLEDNIAIKQLMRVIK